MAKIPKRFHFPYAEDVAKVGYAIRRVGWAGTAKANNWLVYRGGLWWLHAAGEDPRLVEHDDYDREDMLARDWTTQAPTCGVALEGQLFTDTALTEEEQKELARVPAYHELPISSDPLGISCTLPDSPFDALGVGKYQTGRNTPQAGRPNPGVTYPKAPELPWAISREGERPPNPMEPNSEDWGDNLLDPPAPITDPGEQSVDDEVLLTFEDDAEWRAAVYRVRIRGVAIPDNAWRVVGPGEIALNPEFSTAIQASGTEHVGTILAYGYFPAPFSFVTVPGASVRLKLAVAPGGNPTPADSKALTNEPYWNNNFYDPLTICMAIDSSFGSMFLNYYPRWPNYPVVHVADKYGNSTGVGTQMVTATKAGATAGWAITWRDAGPERITHPYHGAKPCVNGAVTFNYWDLGVKATSTVAVPGARLTFTAPGLLPVTTEAFTVPAGATWAWCGWHEFAPPPTLEEGNTYAPYGPYGQVLPDCATGTEEAASAPILCATLRVYLESFFGDTQSYIVKVNGVDLGTFTPFQWVDTGTSGSVSGALYQEVTVATVHIRKAVGGAVVYNKPVKLSVPWQICY